MKFLEPKTNLQQASAAMVQLLATSGSRDSKITTLGEYMDHDDPVVRCTAVTLLAGIIPTSAHALNLLSAALGDEHYFVREAALSTLSQLAPAIVQHEAEDSELIQLWQHLSFIGNVRRSA